MMNSAVILVVDDERNALEIRKLVLEGAGYSVIATTESSEAIRVVESQNIDLVISDHLLIGHTTGADLARQIKRIRPTLPVMLFSGVNDLPEGAENADFFVSKTEGPAALLEKVAAALATNSPGVE
jgi:CheY-like chemotaxis protein